MVQISSWSGFTACVRNSPSSICDAVARYVLGLRKLKGGRIYSGMKPLSHLVLYKCYFFSFSRDSRVCFGLTHRSYFWSGWVIAVQSSETVLGRLWAGGGMFSAEFFPGERREHLGMGTPYSFLFEQKIWESNPKRTKIHCKMTPFIIQFLRYLLLKKYAFRKVQCMDMCLLDGQCLQLAR